MIPLHHRPNITTGLERFELPHKVPKTFVLPLHHKPKKTPNDVLTTGLRLERRISAPEADGLPISLTRKVLWGMEESNHLTPPCIYRSSDLQSPARIIPRFYVLKLFYIRFLKLDHAI